MVRFVNDKLEGIQQGTSATDGVRFDQLDARIKLTQKRNAYFHGSVVSGVIIPVANGTTILDTVESAPPYFYPSQIFIRQVAGGALNLAAGTINIGTNATAYNNIATVTQANLAGLNVGGALNIALGTSVITPLTASSVIRVRIAGLIIGQTAQLAIDILGVYRDV